ncbi:hypothetical protein ACIQU6_30520 [Streptomyces sp. NPDC090442]|uniref:hypothetical protein n=1 Tax=Streptomyces sp. NPDC090442 TaxID=3365962 RepID=UPI00381640F1
MAQNDEFREVYAASGAAFVHSLQLAITVATLMAEHQVRLREERYRQEQQAEENRARMEAEKIRAERAAAEPLLRAAHQEKFWQDLPSHPERLGRTWQAAAEWAGGDPYANFTLQHLREQLAERYNLRVPDWPVGGAEMARLITMTDPTYRDKLDAAREAAAKVPGASYAVIVRDMRNDGRIVHRGEVTAEPGMSAPMAAATAYERWAKGPGDELSQDRQPAEIVVELVENTGSDTAAHVPAATLQGADVESVFVADAARLVALADGTAQPDNNAEMLRALRDQLERLEQEEERRSERRAEYTAKLADGRELSPLDVRRLEGNIQAITEGMDTLHQQQADAALRMAALAAEMRGENPEHVYAAARLSESLDEGFWQTASAAELGDLWGRVAEWSEGEARDGIRTLMRDNIERHHGIMVPQDASADMVSALFGGDDVPGPAQRLSEQAEELRGQAYAVYEEAFDLMGQARELEAKGPEVAEQARLVREQATHRQGQGRALMSQAAWMTRAEPEVMRRLYAENSGDAVRELHAEYALRWGEEPSAATTEKIKEVTAVAADEPGVRVWTMFVPPEASSATSIPAPAVGDPGPTAAPEPAAVVDVEEVDEESERDEAAAREEEAKRAAMEARRVEAAQALATVADPEAVEAVKLTEMAFPEGPEAAVQTAPKVGRAAASGGVQQQRERNSSLEI